MHETITVRSPLQPLRLAARAGRRAYGGVLPERYLQRKKEAFDRAASRFLMPAAAVLDVGGGRAPTIPVDQRPEGCRYVGLDVSADELDAAPPGAYDETRVVDAAVHVPDLEGRFDLVVSWQVLEHVADVRTCIESLRSYLRPGGALVAEMSGRYSIMGAGNALLPPRTAIWLVGLVSGRPAHSVFPAYYDRCWASALQEDLASWTTHEVIPRYVAAAPYSRSSKVLRAAFVTYEEWLVRSCRPNLASYYLIVATR